MTKLEIPLDLDWAKDGEQWQEHLYNLIYPGEENVFGAGEDGLFEQIEITASDPRLTSVLVVQRTASGRILCIILDEQPVQDGDLPDQIAPWREAVLEAARRVGTVFPPATWNAMLGPRPGQRFGASVRASDRRPIALATQTRLGPLLLVPAGTVMHEMATEPGYLLGDRRHPCTSSPIIVEGEAPSYGEQLGTPITLWPIDDLPALRVLHRTASLVSLAWDTHWVVRVEPVRIAPNERITVPHMAWGGDVGEASRWQGGCQLDHTDAEVQQRTLPDWVPQAWGALEREPALDEALTAFSEALAVAIEHPSLAALLLVTVIEGIGAWMTGATTAVANVRMALSTVLPADRVEATARAIYRRRSPTAHRGAVHGPETTLGWVADSDFRIDPAEVFAQYELDQLYDLARNVLIHALTSPAVRPVI